MSAWTVVGKRSVAYLINETHKAIKIWWSSVNQIFFLKSRDVCLLFNVKVKSVSAAFNR